MIPQKVKAVPNRKQLDELSLIQLLRGSKLISLLLAQNKSTSWLWLVEKIESKRIVSKHAGTKDSSAFPGPTQPCGGGKLSPRLSHQLIARMVPEFPCFASVAGVAEGQVCRDLLL